MEQSRQSGLRICAGTIRKPPLIRVTRSPELHRYRPWIAACDERKTGLRLSLSRYRVIGVIGGEVESASLGDKRALRLNRRVSPS